MNKFYIAILICLNYLVVNGQEEAHWLRYPSISPDGSTIAFSYHGNLYYADADGGNAVAITTGDAYDGYPVWSHDGKHIAFASDRYGNFDVFVMSSTGGEAKRLTFHSANEVPSDFSRDNNSIIFSLSKKPSSL